MKEEVWLSAMSSHKQKLINELNFDNAHIEICNIFLTTNQETRGQFLA